MKTVTYDETKWQLVPIIPTGTMIGAGNDEGEWGYYESSLSGPYKGNPADIYKAMLSAAPRSP